MSKVVDCAIPIKFVSLVFIIIPPGARVPSLVMERLHCSLTSLLENNPVVSIATKISIIKDVALGLRYLHTRNPPIIHRDLSSNNVLLSKGMEGKIGDLHCKKCGVHSTPTSCHTIGCVSHQQNFGVLCTPSCGVTGIWCAQHTNCSVLCTPIVTKCCSKVYIDVRHHAMASMHSYLGL